MKKGKREANMRTVVDDSAYSWFMGLTDSQRAAVTGWLTHNPPPAGWKFSSRAYAMVEMPFRWGLWRLWWFL